MRIDLLGWRRCFGAVVLVLALMAVVHGPRGAAASGYPVVLSAAEIDYPPFSMVDETGRPGGFSVELLRAALAAMGRDVVFRTGPWAEVMGWLETGQVQVLPLVGRTPEREDIFDFTVPYMSMYGAIVVREDTEDIRHMDDLRGRNVAVMKADNAEEFLRREERGIHIHTTPTFEKALHELSEGRHDAVVVQRLVAMRLIQETGLKNLRIIDRPIEEFHQDFCFAVQKGDSALLLALLNEGLALVVADGTHRRLHSRWFAALELPVGRIVVGGDHDYPPFEYMDEKGRPAGFNVDLTRAIAREMGLDVEIRLGLWAEMVQGLERGDIDVLAMFYNEERARKFDFTQPFRVIHNIGIVRSGEGEPPSSLEDLQDKRIVVQKGDAIIDHLERHGLAGQITEVETQEDVLRELAEGRHDCALAPRITSLHIIQERGWINLELGRRPFFVADYGYAVPKGHAALLAQFSEGLLLLRESGEFRRIQEKWLGVYEDHGHTFSEILRLAAIILVPLLVLLLAIFLWSWALRRQVRLKTRQLRESEARFRTLFMESPVSIIIHDKDTGAVVDANQEAWTSYGLASLEELQAGKFWLDDPPYSLAEALAWIRKAASQGQQSFEWKNRKASGEEFWEHVRLVPVNIDGVQRVMATSIDITELKRAEEALRQAERYYRSLIHSLHEDILVIDRDYRVTDINNTALRTMGLSREEAVGRQCHKISHGLDAPCHYHGEACGLKSVFESGEPCNLHHEHVMADGSRIYVDIMYSPLRDENGEITHVIEAMRDVTDLFASQEEVQKSEMIHRTLVEALPDIVGRYDREGRHLFVSKNVQEVVDINPALFIGKTHRELGFPEEQCRLWEENIKQVFESGMPHETEYLFQGKTKTILVNWRLEPELDTKGAVSSVLSINRDITARRQAEEEKEKLQAQLLQAQKMEFVGRLAGGVAHDFNNMLQAILINTELALARTDPADPRHGYLQAVVDAGMRSADLTRHLLAFARRQPAAPVALDMNDAMKGMLKMLGRLIGEDIDLDWRPGPGLWTVKIDPVQVDQVLANLCVNARDAIALPAPPGTTPRQAGGVGKITIETDNVILDQDYCAGHAGFVPGEYVLLAVSDNGCGMDKATMEQIFDPFFTTKEAGQGTGLGLSTVYGIVKQNNGFINVYSEPGQGTTFRIYLPRHGGSAEGLKVQDVGYTPRAQGETVMVVEDDASILGPCREALEGLGFAVLPAATPQASLDLAEAHSGRIDLLVTDVIMPGMNGKDLAERLRAQHPELEVLFMSGYTANVIAHHGVLDEGVHFIQKPFTMHALGSKVRAVLDRGPAPGLEGSPDEHSPSPALTQQSLAALPREMLRAMRQAVEDGDMSVLRELISQAADVDKDLAEGLKALEDQYDYEGLLGVMSEE